MYKYYEESASKVPSVVGEAMNLFRNFHFSNAAKINGSSFADSLRGIEDHGLVVGCTRGVDRLACHKT